MRPAERTANISALVKMSMRALVVATAVAATGAGVAIASLAGESVPPVSELTGKTASGLDYRMTWKGSCLRLVVSSADDILSERRECPNPRRGHYAGTYELDCDTGDVLVFGVVGPRVAGARLEPRRRAAIAATVADARLPGARRPFVLSASAADLPAVVRPAGRAARRDPTRLSSRRIACRAVGGDRPSVAFGDL